MHTLKSLLRLTAALALAAGSAFAPSADAMGMESTSVPTVKVSYRDLDLNSEAGAAALYQRIRGAARFVCGEEGRSLEDQLEWKSCYREAVSEAVTAVHSPMLTALETGAAAPRARSTQR